jgi:TCP-1/cpn60 chaperonin family
MLGKAKKVMIDKENTTIVNGSGKKKDIEDRIKEHKDRVDDAMHATRAAVEEGILRGGGVALLRAGKAIEKLRGKNEDQRHGIEIVKKAISWPARQIAMNAGEDGSVVVGKILEEDTYAYGYDAQKGEFGNLVSKGNHRSDQGCPRRAAGRFLNCGPLDHYRGNGGRTAKEGEPGNAGWWRHRWNGRNGLLIAPFILENNKAREFPGPFSCAAAKAGHPPKPPTGLVFFRVPSPISITCSHHLQQFINIPSDLRDRFETNYQARSPSSNALASFRSSLSKPSVNLWSLGGRKLRRRSHSWSRN